MHRAANNTPIQAIPQPIVAEDAWQTALRETITDPRELLARLGLPASLLHAQVSLNNPFPLRVTASYVKRMQPGDPSDPLLRQVLPLQAEEQAIAGFTKDPVGDLASETVPGLLHKYRSRALLVLTGACAIHCRYCFRREFDYSQSNLSSARLAAALEYLAAHDEINEVILSGGDPLSWPDHKLAGLLDQLERIPQLTTLRIHSRQPVVLPQRLTSTLKQLLVNSRLKAVLVLHVNHANELDAELAQRLADFAHPKIILLNQAVLLNGVNNDVDTLRTLSERLFACGILPYYLHLLDPVNGAAHFKVSDETARGLMRQLQAELPGYLIPRLARETAGQASKTLVNY